MTTSSDYITEPEFRDYVGSKGTTATTSIQAAISAASRAVDQHCDRFFYQLDQTMYFSPRLGDLNGYWFLEIDDLCTATTPVIHTDSAGDGTYATLITAGTDFIFEPINQEYASIQGYPYTSLRAKSQFLFPFRFFPWQQDTVKIAGTFGWTAVPDAVKQATRIIAAQLWKLGDAPLGVAGWGAYGDIRVREIPQAAHLLDPYRKGSSFGIA